MLCCLLGEITSVYHWQGNAKHAPGCIELKDAYLYLCLPNTLTCSNGCHGNPESQAAVREEDVVVWIGWDFDQMEWSPILNRGQGPCCSEATFVKWGWNCQCVQQLNYHENRLGSDVYLDAKILTQWLRIRKTYFFWNISHHIFFCLFIVPKL